MACGHSQVIGVDFSEAFAPVANDIAFCMLLTLMTSRQCDALMFAAETAFLNADLKGDMKEELCVDCPEGMDHTDDKCLSSVKTMCGLIQSARCCFAKFKTVLEKMWFVQFPSDPCLFKKTSHDGDCCLTVHVDDNVVVRPRAAHDGHCSKVYSVSVLFGQLTTLVKCLSGPTELAFKEMLRVIKFLVVMKGHGLKTWPKLNELNQWHALLFTDSD